MSLMDDAAQPTDRPEVRLKSEDRCPLQDDPLDLLLCQLLEFARPPASRSSFESVGPFTFKAFRPTVERQPSNTERPGHSALRDPIQNGFHRAFADGCRQVRSFTHDGPLIATLSRYVNTNVTLIRPAKSLGKPGAFGRSEVRCANGAGAGGTGTTTAPPTATIARPSLQPLPTRGRRAPGRRTPGRERARIPSACRAGGGDPGARWPSAARAFG